MYFLYSKTILQIYLHHLVIENLLTDLTYTIDDSRLHFSVDDAEKAIPDIIQKLSKINIPIHSITTETSSLEDVFLDLTGKTINE